MWSSIIIIIIILLSTLSIITVPILFSCYSYFYYYVNDFLEKWLQDSRSVATLAVFALGIVAWRMLRSPSGPRRRQPKRQGTSPSTSNDSHAGTELSSTVASASSEPSMTEDIIDEFFRPVKVGLVIDCEMCQKVHTKSEENGEIPILNYYVFFPPTANPRTNSETEIK